MSDFPKYVQINEEGPREGFQFEKGPISTDRKIELIDALSETGLNHIQVASFVNPNRVPGWADADEVVQRYERKPGVHYTALWLNLKGLQRAMATNRLDIEGSFSLTASPTFLARNQQRSMEDNIEQAHETIKMYKHHNIPLKRASIMAAFGCNFEGEIPHQRVLDLMQQLLDIAAEHGVQPQVFSLADTMAWATPKSIRRTGRQGARSLPRPDACRCICTTRAAWASPTPMPGWRWASAIFDSTVAGLGGCPFAAHKGAAGNVCTEDLVFMLDEMGIETGIDLDKLIEVARLAEDIVGHPLPGSVKMGGSLKALREKLH